MINFVLSLQFEMGAYLCEGKTQKQQVASRQTNEVMYKSAIISVLKPNQNQIARMYFPCQYLGRGVYGTTIQVFLKQKKQQRFTQKIIKTAKVLQNYLFIDRVLFQQLNYSGYFVFTKSIKTDGSKMFILCEKIELGSLYDYIKRHPKNFDYYSIKQLSIRLILILEKLHSKNIIYRSLRPQNIFFINQNGDFQLSELCLSVIGQRFIDFIGPAVYTPPQVYLNSEEGYDKSIDYWMLGVTLYEITLGHTPFQGQNIAQIKENVLNFHSDTIKFDQQSYIIQDLAHFISMLLSSDSHFRTNLDQIKRHRFFNGSSWDQDRQQHLLTNLKQNFENQQRSYPSRIIYNNLQKQKTQQFQLQRYEDKLLYEAI